MIAIPAVDLRNGACVQLVGGSYADERVRLEDPVAVARKWTELGFRRLHVVDLDAATGSGANTAIVAAIVRDVNAVVQVGGGVRTGGRVEELIAGGAASIVVGTRALVDYEWIGEQAARFPDRLVVALDIRGGRVTTHGWTKTLVPTIERYVADLSLLPLAGILVTAIDVEGQMRGPDAALTGRIISASRVPVIASGGIASLEDLRTLAALGVSAAVIGMALYMERLDVRAVIEEFGQ
jgi:phosphoribosylformimino-5-aminoimidazole carboxamide ribotide isomerase